MVSELPRRSSYVAAVSGVDNATLATHASTPITRSPIRPVPEAIPQRNLNFQSQRSYDVEEEENPLILGANDNPCTILVSPPLAGSSNYNTWSISMRNALEVKNKWSLVNGAIPPPSMEQNHYSAWRRCNLIICSWIFKSLHPSIAQSVMHFEKAKDIWEDLRRRFVQCDAQRISILQNDIYSLK
ncbi:uncharacterized protein LOC116016114 [Ipomoea triloba]|uniref:uncharacterized protein LOC116016114 n=1 Tax=Ipomoea triloba TaxID=35885 RepID=UPI00125D802A|nr:uncharacterized protein LOC116016114 [Ipomoea triloba]